MWRHKKLCGILLFLACLCNLKCLACGQGHAKEKGDIYVVSEMRFDQDKAQDAELMAGGATERDDTNAEMENVIDFGAIMDVCNASFSIPMDYVTAFNSTGELPNTVDKTGMCYIRCFYEKSGLIEDWQLNADKIRQYMWPATGDSIEFCQQQGKSEANACVHLYEIAKCLMTRAIVDARNKPL